MNNYGCVMKYKQLIMSKSPINIKKTLQEIDKTFSIIEKLDNEDLEKLNFKDISKRINQVENKLSKKLKNSLDSKK